MPSWHSLEAEEISDPHGYLFLPRAMLRIASARIPAWTGDEPVFVVKFERESATRARRVRGYNQAYKARSELQAAGKAIPPSITAILAEKPLAPTLRPPDQEGRDAVERFAQLCATITEACRSGALICGWRPKVGGAITVIPQDWWNTEEHRLRDRFRWFDIDPASPFYTERRYQVTGPRG